MTRANTEQTKFVPWFAKAGAACSIVPIARFIGSNIFALKGGGYGCLFALTGIDEEGLTDQELESRMRSIEGALRGLPEGACLYQYTRVMSGYELPRQKTYSNPVTQVFVEDRLTFLGKTVPWEFVERARQESPKCKVAFRRLTEAGSTGCTGREWCCACVMPLGEGMHLRTVEMEPSNPSSPRRNLSKST